MTLPRSLTTLSLNAGAALVVYLGFDVRRSVMTARWWPWAAHQTHDDGADGSACGPGRRRGLRARARRPQSGRGRTGGSSPDRGPGPAGPGRSLKAPSRRHSRLVIHTNSVRPLAPTAENQVTASAMAVSEPSGGQAALARPGRGRADRASAIEAPTPRLPGHGVPAPGFGRPAKEGRSPARDNAPTRPSLPRSTHVRHRDLQVQDRSSPLEVSPIAR